MERVFMGIAEGELFKGQRERERRDIEEAASSGDGTEASRLLHTVQTM